MKQIVPPIALAEKILGKSKNDEGCSCRLSTHHMRIECPEGALLYHTLTGELLLLSCEEAARLEELSGSLPPSLQDLARRRFLVPSDADDMALANQALAIARRMKRRDDTLTKYKIFTTTECNARCFYCYEAGWKKSTMTEETAIRVAAYIKNHCNGKPVRLDWFGGEPLVNIRAINIITDILIQHGIAYHSTMASNGYLFDAPLVRRAVDVWKLREVYITLDGTEEVYNRRKAYVHSCFSPFLRVLHNMDLLLDAGICVKIRLNVDEENESDLHALLDILAERFAGKAGFGVHVVPICLHKEMNPLRYADAQKFLSLCAHTEELGIALREPLRRSLVSNSCIADSDSATTITPEGKLGRCNSCLNGTIWGNIYTDDVADDVLQAWREYKPAEDMCGTCAIYPQCVRVRKCPSWPIHCSPIEQAYRINGLRWSVLTAYEEWKAANQP